VHRANESPSYIISCTEQSGRYTVWVRCQKKKKLKTIYYIARTTASACVCTVFYLFYQRTDNVYNNNNYYCISYCSRGALLKRIQKRSDGVIPRDSAASACSHVILSLHGDAGILTILQSLNTYRHLIHAVIILMITNTTTTSAAVCIHILTPLVITIDTALWRFVYKLRIFVCFSAERDVYNYNNYRGNARRLAWNNYNIIRRRRPEI